MNKYVLTIFLLDKTIAFLVIKPFNRSVCQSANLLSKIKSYGPQLQILALAKESNPLKRDRPI